MTESYIQLPADDAGKALATEEITQSGAPSTNKARLQKLLIANASGVIIGERKTGVVVRADQGDVATGNLAGTGQTVTCAVTGHASAAIGLSGTYTIPFLVFEGSDDGGSTYPYGLPFFDSIGGFGAVGLYSTTNNATTLFFVSCIGMTHVRVRAFSYTSGTGAVRITPAATPMSHVGSGNVAVLGTVDTELPAATTLSATLSRTASIPNVGAAMLVDNGSNLVRLRGDVSNGADVDVTRMAALVAGTAAIGKVGHDVTGIGDGRKVVTTAGTRVTLASTTAAKQAVITAETDNTGIVVVGGSTVVAALATRAGTPLSPGDTMIVPCDDLAEIYLDSMVSGDGVTFTCFT